MQIFKRGFLHFQKYGWDLEEFRIKSEETPNENLENDFRRKIDKIWYASGNYLKNFEEFLRNFMKILEKLKVNFKLMKESLIIINEIQKKFRNLFGKFWSDFEKF